MPLVSVVIPALGTRGGALRAAIDSAIYHQTRIDLEVIVVDDATPDESVARLAADLPVRYVRMDVNGGVAAAERRGVDVAEGRHVAFLHSDDRFPENRPWPTVRNGIAAGALQYGDERRPSKLPGATPNSFLWHQFPVQISAYVFDIDLLRAEPFDPALRCWEDWDLLYRMTVRGAPVVESDAVFAVIGGDESDRLSHGPHMGYSLAYLFDKYRDVIGANRSLRAHWEFKIGRILAVAGENAASRPWLARSVLRYPVRPRRAVVALKLASRRSRTAAGVAAGPEGQ